MNTETIATKQTSHSAPPPANPRTTYAALQSAPQPAILPGMVPASKPKLAGAAGEPQGARRRPQPPKRSNDMKFNFASTDVSEVLRALSLRTRANIVYRGETLRPISISVTVTNVEEALRYITATAGLAYRQVGNTYVVAPSATLRQAIEPFGQQVIVPLNNLTPMEAVRVVESALPYVTVRPAGNQVVLIGAPGDLRQAQELIAGQTGTPGEEPVANDLVALQSTVPADVVNVLKSVYPNLKAEPFGDPTKGTAGVGLSGPRSVVERARDQIRALEDAAKARGGREFRIYNIRYSSAPVLVDFIARVAPNVVATIGPDNFSPPRPNFRPLTGASIGTASTGIGGGTSGGGGGAGGAGGFAAGGTDSNDPARRLAATGERAKVLILSGPAGDVDALIALLNQVDVAPRQVLVEVRIVDVSPQFVEQLGVQYNFGNVAVTRANNGAGTIDPSNGQLATPVLSAFNNATFGVLGPSFGAIISAIRTRTDSRLLADPRIAVLDNDDASIFIGDTIRTTVSQASVSGTTIQVLEFPVGIILLVRPRINADGRITMRVHPVVSTVTGLGAGNIPNTSNREAETTLLMQDGETIVIGGLIRDDFIKSIQEVPILSKLPLLGELFRYRNTTRRHSEIMVFITTRILTENVTLPTISDNTSNFVPGGNGAKQLFPGNLFPSNPVSPLSPLGTGQPAPGNGLPAPGTGTIGDRSAPPKSK